MDSNTWISAVLFPESVPGLLLKMLRRRAIIVISLETMIELSSVLLRPKFERYLPLARRKAMLSRIRKQVRLIDVPVAVRVCRDAKDDKFLSLALAGAAHLVVTGDLDLLVLHPFEGIEIMTAFACYEKLKASREGGL